MRGILCVIALIGLPLAAIAQDCTGHVVDLRPITQYDHARGTAYLAVRAAPGADQQQLGELYLGDRIAVFERRGNWYRVECRDGTCLAPLWGAPQPAGWVYGGYIRLHGVCR